MTREEVIENLLKFDKDSTKSHLTKEKAEKFVDYLGGNNFNINNYDNICDLLKEIVPDNIESISENVGIPIGYIHDYEVFTCTVYENGNKILDVDLFVFPTEDALLEQGYTVDKISKIIGEKFDVLSTLHGPQQLCNFTDEFCKNGIVTYNY